MTKIENKNKIGDFYWAYADILRGIGVNESMYDQRIMAFMALKLLVDNELVVFNFDWRNDFGLSSDVIEKYKKNANSSTKDTFSNIIKDISAFGNSNRLINFTQKKELNPDAKSENILFYMNYKKTFTLLNYIDELEDHYLEMVLDIYVEKANFFGYPKEKYKDLYETTIARMKKLSGDLTGQHFTQQSIIHLMCESAVSDLQKSKSLIIAIYDPTCGTGSMLMESAYYFDKKINFTDKGNRKRKTKDIEVYGQEMHGQTWLLCKIFLEISGIKNTIACGNTLTNPAFDKINGDNSFDFIIANPPFGVDWKHDYNKVIENMERGEKSDYLVVRDSNKLITPKKSDGQFLFILHILKLLENSKKHNKHAKAAVISSTGLITSGKKSSAEGKIRGEIFKGGYAEALLEQPKAMFTNTDISTLIWFFDNQNLDKRKNKTLLIKTDNKYINAHFKNKKIKVLYDIASIKKDKQKHKYSEKNIEALSTILDHKYEFKLFSKYKSLDDEETIINFEDEFHYDPPFLELAKLNKFDVEQAYNALSLALMFEAQLQEQSSHFTSQIDKLMTYIDGGYTDTFFENYIQIYKEVLDMIIHNKKNAFKLYEDMLLKQKKKELEEINCTFDFMKDVNSKTKMSLECS